MKSKIFHLLLILAFFSSCSTKNAENKTIAVVEPKNKDFYDLEWGMSKESVISALGKEIEDSYGDLHYPNKEVSGLKCAVYCAFISDSLSQGLFTFQNPSPTNPQAYISEFDRLKSLLIEKYSIPKSDTVKCSNTTLLENKKHWGTALYLGTLEILTTWETPRSIIGLSLKNSSSDKVVFALIYYDRTKFGRILNESKSSQKQGL